MRVNESRLLDTRNTCRVAECPLLQRSLLEQRVPQVEGGGVLVLMGHREHDALPVDSPDERDAGRHARGREAIRYRHRRLASQVRQLRVQFT